MPGEKASELVKLRVAPGVKRRWEDALRRAVYERRARTAQEFLDKLLEREEKAVASGRAPSPFR